MEAFIEVRTPDTRAQITEILNALRDDREKSRTMQPDGTYIREANGEGTSSQERLYQYFSKRRVSLQDDTVSEEKSVESGPKPRTEKMKPETAWAKFRKLFG